MKKVTIAMLVTVSIILADCGGKQERYENDSSNLNEDTIVTVAENGVYDAVKNEVSVEVMDTCMLRIYYPKYSRIDLVCREMPKKEDESVIMFAEAAFTGELLDTFKHSNIAGDHVSNGIRHKGYSCKRNNGAFVWHDGKAQFLYKNYSPAFDNAARNGGCGFAQEMMIHNGKEVVHTRSADNANEFRALCLIGDSVAIADSDGYMTFGEFIDKHLKA